MQWSPDGLQPTLTLQYENEYLYLSVYTNLFYSCFQQVSLNAQSQQAAKAVQRYLVALLPLSNCLIRLLFLSVLLLQPARAPRRPSRQLGTLERNGTLQPLLMGY